MTVPGPLFVIGTPLVIGAIVYLLRRAAPLAALVTGLTTLLLAWVTYALPLDQPAHVGRLVVDLGVKVNVLDRVLSIDPGVRPLLAFMFLVSTALFWFGWRADQGPLFFPLGLVLLSIFCGVLMIQPFQYAALLWAIAASIAAFLIQGGRPGSTQASQRYLVMAVIALPPILVAGWELEKFVDTPDETSLLRIAALMFACTFAVLLASVPFHSWVPAVGAEAPPLVAALVFSVGQAVVVTWLLALLQANPALLRYIDMYRLFSLAGLGMVLLGGLLAFSRVSFGRLMGYAALVDMGALLMALGLGNAAGLQAALMTLVLRAIGLTITTAGMSVLRTRVPRDLFESVRGLGWQMPLATTAIMLGGLSLAGFPLTPGFVGRWALLRLLAQRDSTYALVLFMAGVSVSIGYMRGLGALLAPPPRAAAIEVAESPAPVTAEDVQEVKGAGAAEATVAAGAEAGDDVAVAPRRRAAPRFPRLRLAALRRPAWRAPFSEGLITGAMLVVGISVCIAVAVAPQLILPWVGQAANLYTFFGS